MKRRSDSSIWVYPRTGGGNNNISSRWGAKWGLSPHGRGKHCARTSGPSPTGSIPARAGETDRPDAARSATRVYPRTGGGNPNCAMCRPVLQVYPRTGGGNWPTFRLFCHGRGLSPHGRGKHSASQTVENVQGSIPARAGETQDPPGSQSYYRVYPRTGGGNAAKPPSTAVITGLSPHGRGKLHSVQGLFLRMGSIPARAGETPTPFASGVVPRVYPRTGGGNSSSSILLFPQPGLSPHGRGKPGTATWRSLTTGSIPARAGETATKTACSICCRVYPRTGGGNDNILNVCVALMGLSPHGRGKLLCGKAERSGDGSIPARAGETSIDTEHGTRIGVYPRTGGGNEGTRKKRFHIWGLSPHGRGKLWAKTRRFSPTGSIPARAGETSRARKGPPAIRVYPRTGGGNGSSLSSANSAWGLSPHGRGKLL